MKWVDSCSLLGAALDWAVAKAEGLEPVIVFDCEYNVGVDVRYPYGGYQIPCPRFSTQGGCSFHITEREKISVIYVEEDDPYPIEDGPWAASVKGLDYGATGPTALIAAMRCYVCLKLGDTIEIPDELVNGG